MPNIPTIVAPEQVSIPQMSPQAAGQPGTTLAHSGEEITSAADYGVQASEKIRAAQQQLALLAAGNQITSAWNKYQETLAQSGDPDHMPDPEAWKDDLKKSFADNPKYADPRVSRAVDLHIDSVGEDARHVTTMRQLTLQKQQEDAELDNLHESTAYDMAEAPDPNSRAIARGKYETAVGSAERHGWITPTEADAKLRSLDSTAEDVEIVNAINKDNPSAIQAMIDKTASHPELFKDLNPARFADLKKYLRAALDSANARQSRTDVAGQGDLILAKYRNDVTLKDPETKEYDPMQGVKKVDDDPDVPTDVKKYVREELEQEAGATQKLQNDQDLKMLNDLDPLVESGKLTMREITQRENLPPGTKDWIPRRVADPMLTKAAQIQRENRTMDLQARSEMRQERLDKSADIRDELLGQPGILLTQGELSPYRKKGLSPGDANIVWKSRGPQSDPAFGLAIKQIQSSAYFAAPTDEKKGEMSTFILGFARTVETKQLTGQQITDEATKELGGLNKQAVGSWLDRIKQFGAVLPGVSTRKTWTKEGAPAAPPQRPSGVPANAVWNPQGNGGQGSWQLP